MSAARKASGFPEPHERWVDKGSKRPAVVVAIGRGQSSDVTVSYRYVQGINGSGLWRRGVVPVQTINIHDWLRRFAPEPKEAAKR